MTKNKRTYFIFKMSQCFALPVSNLWKDSTAERITKYNAKSKQMKDKQNAIKNWKIKKSEFESGITTTESFSLSRFQTTF